MPEKRPPTFTSDLASVPFYAESTDEGTEEVTPQDQIDKQTPFSDEELEYFRNLIVERRREAVDDIERMRAQLEDAREQRENDTAYSFHMADAGTDAMEREKLYLMIARQQKYVGYLDRALERIKNKTYGICKVTGKPISKERLEAVPHTEISIEAKLKQKK
ncbi:MAG TPA: TraR/DksA C4-type zinc finger protein [Rhodothermales bacterium]|nr:TraR/DksA C4-type zinc finger protein [Rhodothermales bacterium]